MVELRVELLAVARPLAPRLGACGGDDAHAARQRARGRDLGGEVLVVVPASRRQRERRASDPGGCGSEWRAHARRRGARCLAALQCRRPREAREPLPYIGECVRVCVPRAGRRHRRAARAEQQQLRARWRLEPRLTPRANERG
eukprot:6808162-Prymnesium_polylepis.1